MSYYSYVIIAFKILSGESKSKKLIELAESKLKEPSINPEYSFSDNPCHGWCRGLISSIPMKIKESEFVVWTGSCDHFNPAVLTCEDLKNFFESLYKENLMDKSDNIVIIHQGQEALPAKFVQVRYKNAKLTSKEGDLPFSLGSIL